MDEETNNRYWCFISYRHADNKEQDRDWASWLHQEIERYDVPAELVGTTNKRGDVIPERIYPVFRDEESLPADANLADSITIALDRSRFLVVLCSPKAVKSKYVAQEIDHFKESGKGGLIIAAILDGEPGSPNKECFPAPLQNMVDDKGKAYEPIAADFRLADGTEGFTSPEAYRLHRLSDIPSRMAKERAEAYEARLNLMKLKIIAGILGLPLEKLSKRDKAYQLELAKKRTRNLRRWLMLTSVLFVLATIAGVIAVANEKRAQEQRDQSLINQSRFLADLSMDESESGNVGNGLLLALEALPDPEAEFQRPFVPEAAASLANALHLLREIAAVGPVDSYATSESTSKIVTLEPAPGGFRPVIRSLIDGKAIHELPLHEGERVFVDFGADGTVITKTDDQLRLWSPEGKLIKDLGTVESFDVSRDLPLFLTITKPNRITIHELPGGNELRSLSHNAEGVNNAWFVDQSRLIRAVLNPGLGDFYFEVTTGEALNPSEDKLKELKDESSTTVVKSPDGKKKVFGLSRRGTLNAKLIAIEGEQEIADLSKGEITEGGANFDAVFSLDSRKVVTQTPGNTGTIWDATTGERVATLKGHQLPLTSLSLSPDGSLILTGAEDGTARLWNLKNGAPVTVLGGHEKGRIEAEFAARGSRIITITSTGEDDTLRIWRTNHLEPRADFVPEPGFGIGGFAFSEDGSRFAYGETKGRLHIHSTSREKPVTIDLRADFLNAQELASAIAAHGENGPFHFMVDRIQFSPDGKRLAAEIGMSVSSPSTYVTIGSAVEIRETETGELIFRTPFANSSYNDAFTVSDDLRFLIAESDEKIVLFDTEKAVDTGSFNGFNDHMESIFSPDSQFLAVSDFPNTIRLFSTDSLQLLWEYTHENSDQISTALESFDPSSRLLVVSDRRNHEKQGLDILDCSTGEVMLRLDADSYYGNVREASFSADSDFLCVVFVKGTRSGTSTFVTWEVETGRQIEKWEMDSLVGDIELSSDGKYLVATQTQRSWGARYEDMPASVFHPQTGQLHFQVEGAVEEIAISQDAEPLLAARLRNGGVSVWSLHIGKRIATFSSTEVAARKVELSPSGNLIAISGGVVENRETENESTRLRLFTTPKPNQSLRAKGREVAPRGLTKSQRAKFFLTPETPAWVGKSDLWPTQKEP